MGKLVRGCRLLVVVCGLVRGGGGLGVGLSSRGCALSGRFDRSQ